MNKKNIILVFFIGLFFISIICKKSNISAIEEGNQSEKYQVASLTPHLPFFITHDDNFTHYGFSGFGNKTHPYIIEDYSITSSDAYGIYIENTTKFFIIRNCYIDAGEIGIYILDIADGTASILKNICKNNEVGIKLIDTSQAILANNTCTNNEFGIRLYRSPDAKITSNICKNNGFHGIYFENCLSPVLINNTCSNNKICGTLLYASFGTCFLNNTCSDNNLNGLYLDATMNAHIINNTFERNIRYGIELYISDYCFITYNALLENNLYGLYLQSGSDNNVIHHNTFHFNNLGGTSQAYDDGNNNQFYEIATNQGNYWSNYLSGSYSIDGSSNSVDPYPLGEPLVPVSEYIQGDVFIVFIVPCLVLILFVFRKEKKKN
ncbi:MAG: nitrous oxide reductase family maturation protein NosD [Candidatus Thorarchaeota archaeon]